MAEKTIKLDIGTIYKKSPKVHIKSRFYCWIYLVIYG